MRKRRTCPRLLCRQSPTPTAAILVRFGKFKAVFNLRGDDGQDTGGTGRRPLMAAAVKP